jgi:hypothetical protein
VLDAINASFNEPAHMRRAAGAEDADEGEYDEEDSDPDAEYDEDEEEDGREIGPHQCEVHEPDANELFWDEFFDSLIITVPFTFLYILLDMYVSNHRHY